MNSLGLEEEIIEGVQIDINRRRPSRKERSPLPPVVFRIQQEIRADDCHTDGDSDENEKYQQHEAVHVVNLVGPEGRENEVPDTKPLLKDCTHLASMKLTFR